MRKLAKKRRPARSDIGKSVGKNTSRTAASRTKEGRAIAYPMPQIIAQIPHEGQSRDQWDANITSCLVTIWFKGMSTADLEIGLSREPGSLARISPEAFRALDQIIIGQAVTLGWRIGLSSLVHWRLSEWELVPDGLKLLSRFHRAVERAARIFQRLKKPPLDDPNLYSFKVETVKELRILLSEMRDSYRDRLSDSPDLLEQVVVAHFLKVVKGRSKRFRLLAVNYPTWQEFFKEQPTLLRQHLSEVRLRPASLFNSWFSWCKGVSEEWLRQAISRLGSSPSKPIRIARL